MRGMLLVLAGLLLAAAGQELSQAYATGVLGRKVLDAGGQQVGRVVDVVVDPSGQPRAIVVDTGGFLGVGARRVAVAWAATHMPPPGNKNMSIFIDLTDAQVKSAPAYTDRSKPAIIVGPPPEPAAKP